MMNALRSYISKSLLDMDSVDNSDTLIEEFLKENYKIYGSYTIKDGVVDVKGRVEVMDKNITHLTNGLFRFGVVKGHFDCIFCESLTSLEGAPEIVEGYFDCGCCRLLTSLKGAPEIVEGYFNCGCCYLLTSLKGAPDKVGERFYCNHCGKQFTKEEVAAVCKVRKSIFV